MTLTERLKIRNDIRLTERRIDSLLMEREAIDLQLDLSARTLEAKRTLEAFLNQSPADTRSVKFMEIE